MQKRTSHSSILLLIVALALGVSIFPVVSEDIWWHLKAGELILKYQGIPPADAIVHTVSPGTKWQDTQWLFQVAVYFVWKNLGWNGLIAMRAAFAVILAILLWGWTKSRQTPAIPLLLSTMFVVLIASQRINDRPELPSFIFLATELFILDSHMRRKRLHTILYLLIIVLWANTHSSAVLGVILPGVFGIVVFLRSCARLAPHSDPTTDRQLGKRLMLLCCAATMALCINPNGWTLLTFGLLESRKNIIVEFNPPYLFGGFYVGILAIAVAALGVFGKETLPYRSAWGIWGLLCAIQYLRMVRFFPYAAVSWAPLFASAFTTLWSFPAQPWNSDRSKRFKVVLLRTVTLMIFAVVLFERLITSGILKNLGKTGVDFSKWPVGAADYIVNSNLRGNLFNGFDEGGYLMWRLVPDRKIFMFNECRLNEKTLEDGMRVHKASEFRQFLGRYGINYALVGYNLRRRTGLRYEGMVDAFQDWQDWVPVYWDDRNMVWVNTPGVNDPIVQRDRCFVNPEWIPSRENRRADISPFMRLKNRPEIWNKIPGECTRLSRSAYPFKAHYALGLWHDISGSTPSLALNEYNKALLLDPGIPSLLTRIGNLNIRMGTTETALGYFEKAVEYADSPLDAMYNLAVAQYKLGQLEKAMETAQRILKKDPAHKPTTKLMRIIKARKNAT